jgi:hypothetical protein
VTELKKVSENQDNLAKAKNVNWIKLIPEEGEIEGEENKAKSSKEIKDHKGMIGDTGCPNSIVRK